MRLGFGITGHRDTNPAYGANSDGIKRSLNSLFGTIDAAVAANMKPRLHALLSLGTDVLAVEMALSMGWQVAAPLPFGKALNIAINAQPQTIEDATALLNGIGPCSDTVAVSAKRIADVADRVTCFELAERDALIQSLFWDSLKSPEDISAQQAFAVAASERAALAGQVMIGQIDMLIAVWDGHSPGPVGGTRHTIARALEIGVVVLWINAGQPDDWRLLDNPEALANRWNLSKIDAADIMRYHLSPLLSRDETGTAQQLLDHDKQPVRSRKRYHIYRRIEVLFAGDWRGAFGSLTQHYASEEEVLGNDADGILSSARTSSGTDPKLLQQTEDQVIRRFVRADAVATYLSDAYRGGMVANLLMAAFAVIGGIAYLPFFDVGMKWPFAVFELALLGSILLIIAIGRKRDWHGRWFQTRRVAEYLRHAPFMLFLGIARPAGSWPQSSDADWPEDYVRSILREIGLPNVAISQASLRTALEKWIGAHVSAQRAYHVEKAKKLERIHHNLEAMSERLFMLAMLVVATYLIGEAASWAGLLPIGVTHKASKLFTFLGVALPTLGGALAGIHYFADFGRFAAISESTASRLMVVEQRIATLLAAPDDERDYGRVASIARAVDQIVVSEIEHWQDVFGGKHISVPV
jgi:hypothetical protein